MPNSLPPPFVDSDDTLPLIKPTFLSSGVIKLFREGIKIYKYSEELAVFKPPLKSTHKFVHDTVEGIETLTAVSNPQNPYIVYCCGMDQNAMEYELNTLDSNKNYVFWNYPGKGLSSGSVKTPNDIYRPAYRQVQRLLAKGITASQITLYGYSLGGGVAIRVTRQLHEEGQWINLYVDRSFGRLSSVIPALIKKINAKYVPLVSSLAFFTVSGITLGVVFAGVMTSIAQLLGQGISSLAFYIGFGLQLLGIILQVFIRLLGKIIGAAVGCFAKASGDAIATAFSAASDQALSAFVTLSTILKKVISHVVSIFRVIIDLLSSFMGTLISFGGLVVGSFLGAMMGLLLSVQLLWTKTPATLPVISAFRGILYAFGFDIDSVKELNQVLAISKKSKPQNNPSIIVMNTVNDELVDVSASLNAGLGTLPTKPSNPSLKSKVTSFWYAKGGHHGKAEGLLSGGLAASG